jgi:hypothetical protein
MKINDLDVTGSFFEKLDDTTCHVELGGCIRLVHLSDTDYSSIEDLGVEIETNVIQ